MRKRGMKYNTTKKLHKWVKRDYRPHSNFVVIKPECVNEVTATLLLLKYKRRGNRQIKLNKQGPQGEDQFVNTRPISYPHNRGNVGIKYALYRDGDAEWILTRHAIKDLGI